MPWWMNPAKIAWASKGLWFVRMESKTITVMGNEEFEQAYERVTESEAGAAI